MKILITGDWHLTDKKPKNRKDDYFQTLVGKLDWICNLYHKEDCKLLLQPGDFFDSYKANDFLKQFFIDFFWQRSIDIYGVYGQHDLRFHSSDKSNTPLKVLESAGTVSVLKQESTLYDGVYFYGASWGEEIPEIKKPGITILVTHRMVIGKDKVWEGQEEYERASHILREHKFDLIVTGDNHQSFTQEHTGRYLINAGSLMRSTVDQLDHKPTVFIYNAENKRISERLIPVQPIEMVFDLERVEYEKERNEELDLFINNLNENFLGMENMDFKKNLFQYLEENQIEEGINQFIREVINE